MRGKRAKGRGERRWEEWTGGGCLDAVLAVHQLHVQAAEDTGLVAPVLQLHAGVPRPAPPRPLRLHVRQRALVPGVGRVAVLQLLRRSRSPQRSRQRRHRFTGPTTHTVAVRALQQGTGSIASPCCERRLSAPIGIEKPTQVADLNRRASAAVLSSASETTAPKPSSVA